MTDIVKRLAEAAASRSRIPKRASRLARVGEMPRTTVLRRLDVLIELGGALKSRRMHLRTNANQINMLSDRAIICLQPYQRRATEFAFANYQNNFVRLALLSATLSAPTRRCRIDGPGLGTNARVTARHARESYTPATAPIPTCWPAKREEYA